MTESSEIVNSKDIGTRTVRMAYTLNNAQPVLCSIISDQPVFYMDVEDAAEDHEHDDTLFLMDDNLRMLENEIQALQREIQSLQRLGADHAKAPEARHAEILESRDFMTQATPVTVSDITIEALKESLLQSRMAACYLEFAGKHGIEIIHSAQVAGATYERRTSKILINPHMSAPEQGVLLSRELRRHWQHRHGALLHPLVFHPDHAILVNRLQAADLATAMVRIAWELQLAGDKGAWDYIENSQMADLGRAFAREAYLDFRTLNNGQASAALVESWFLSERCRTQDKVLIRQMLADYKGYVFSQEQSVKTLTPAVISALGSVPYGNNYLAKHAQTILADPIFTEIRDRSNANFLWFIKFEQSFRETEQELQDKGLSKPVDNSTNRSLHSEFNPSSQIPSHAAQKAAQTAEIICLASKRGEDNGQYKPVDKSAKNPAAGPSEGVGGKRGPSAQIVSFTRTRGE